MTVVSSVEWHHAWRRWRETHSDVVRVLRDRPEAVAAAAARDVRAACAASSLARAARAAALDRDRATNGKAWN